MTKSKLARRGVGVALGVVLVGCSPTPPGSDNRPASAAPYVSASGLHDLLRSPQRRALVEFSVEHGCFRCEEMRPQIERLAEDAAPQWVVRRVNINLERPLAASLGISVCPTYVGFVDGREVFRAEYPTSEDLLRGELASVNDFPSRKK